ncbi:MAG: rhodanese-like domain-containing protein [Pseudomonadota bacterium]
MSRHLQRLALIAPIAILLAIVAVVLLFPKADARAKPVETSPFFERSNVDYAGFEALTSEVAAYRETRLISLTQFMEMAQDPDTLILDTRSARAFEEGHIAGAVHLNFSDFTKESLAEAIGDKSRRILIYCNNNFADDVAPVMEKRVELALNIPTFVNLYGYGYANVYELGELIEIEDLSTAWVRGTPLL